MRLSILEPESPVLHRTMWAGAAIFYVAGFFNFIWFGTAIALWFFASMPAEDYGKYQRERRMAEYRAKMDAWEQAAMANWRWQRTQFLITPDWML